MGNSNRAGFGKGKVFGRFAIIGTPVQNVEIHTGNADDRAEVLAQIPNAPIGSVYSSYAGEVFIRVAKAGVAADFQKVTTTAAD